jgi:hypothetical protein
MKDNEIRGIVLKHFYEKKDQHSLTIRLDDFEEKFSQETLSRICRHLDQTHLIENWCSNNNIVNTNEIGRGRISPKGIDIVEGKEEPSLSINFTNNKKTYNQTIFGSNNSTLAGENNSQNINSSINDILNYINNSTISENERNEAKLQFSKFLKHPAVIAIFSSVFSSDCL